MLPCGLQGGSNAVTMGQLLEETVLGLQWIPRLYWLSLKRELYPWQKSWCSVLVVN